MHSHWTIWRMRALAVSCRLYLSLAFVDLNLFFLRFSAPWNWPKWPEIAWKRPKSLGRNCLKLCEKWIILLHKGWAFLDLYCCASWPCSLTDTRKVSVTLQMGGCTTTSNKNIWQYNHKIQTSQPCIVIILSLLCSHSSHTPNLLTSPSAEWSFREEKTWSEVSWFCLSFLSKSLHVWKLIVWKFKGITVTFSAFCNLKFHCNCSFLLLLRRIQLQQRIPLWDFRNIAQVQLQQWIVFALNMQRFRKEWSFVCFGVLLLAHHQCNFKGAFFDRGGQRYIAAVTPFEVNYRLPLFGADPAFLLFLFCFCSLLLLHLLLCFLFCPFLFSPCRDLLA